MNTCGIRRGAAARGVAVDRDILKLKVCDELLFWGLCLWGAWKLLFWWGSVSLR
ncbi:MAG: hypothetical protein ACKESB_01500 [Candidatus Hodgkinia cicadicola]